MKLRLSSILPLIVLSGALYAQAPDRAGGGDKETTMQGCLTKDAANQSQYVLRDDKTNATTMVSGSPDLLEKHNNHTVKLTGAETTENVDLFRFSPPTRNLENPRFQRQSTTVVAISPEPPRRNVIAARRRGLARARPSGRGASGPLPARAPACDPRTATGGPGGMAAILLG